MPSKKHAVVAEALGLGRLWKERELQVEEVLGTANSGFDDLGNEKLRMIWNALALRRAAGVAQYGIDGGYIDRPFIDVDNEILGELLDQINWSAFAIVKLKAEGISGKQRQARGKLYEDMINSAVVNIIFLLELEPLH